jgi:cytochrome c553
MSFAERQNDRDELAQIATLDIRCDDCGRSKRMWPGAIADISAQGTRTLIGLHSRLFCAVCHERGGTGKNISLAPSYRRARR